MAASAERSPAKDSQAIELIPRAAAPVRDRRKDRDKDKDRARARVATGLPATDRCAVARSPAPVAGAEVTSTAVGTAAITNMAHGAPRHGTLVRRPRIAKRISIRDWRTCRACGAR